MSEGQFFTKLSSKAIPRMGRSMNHVTNAGSDSVSYPPSTTSWIQVPPAIQGVDFEVKKKNMHMKY